MKHHIIQICYKTLSITRLDFFYFGTIPIAEALLAKGAQLGVVLSFMMGVTTLSLPSIIMLRKAVKPKLLGIFVTVCTVGIILVGYFFNTIQYLLV